MKSKIIFLLLCTFSFMKSQNISFSDPNFKTFLVNSDTSSPNDYIYDSSYNAIKLDANSDGEISYTEAAQTFAIMIADFGGTGITANIATVDNLQNFTGLNMLYISTAPALTSVSVSNNSTITQLLIGNAPLLSSVSVNSCSSFTSIFVTSSSNVSAISLSNLPLLDAYTLQDSGAIQSINLSTFPVLTSVEIVNAAQLTSLNVKNGSSEINRYLDNVPALNSVCTDSGEVADWQSTVTQAGSSATVSNCTTLAAIDTKIEKSKLVSPNPVKDWIRINTDQIVSKVEIYDISGKVVKESKETTLNLSDLSKGIYFIKVYNSKGVVSSKIIKN